jgi:hypothetical protein
MELKELLHICFIAIAISFEFPWPFGLGQLQNLFSVVSLCSFSFFLSFFFFFFFSLFFFSWAILRFFNLGIFCVNLFFLPQFPCSLHRGCRFCADGIHVTLTITKFESKKWSPTSLHTCSSNQAYVSYLSAHTSSFGYSGMRIDELIVF